MKGLRKNLIYAIRPCLLGLCGPSDKGSKNLILEFLRGKKVGKKQLIEYSKQLKSAFSYLCKIAEANKIKNPFDEKVVEAYWLGNSLLKKCPNAHHSYHVLFVGSLKNIAPIEKLAVKCVINCGKVEKIGSNCLFIKTGPLEFENGKGGSRTPQRVSLPPKAKLGAGIIRKIEFDPDILPNIAVGDIVSYHWDFACEAINKQQAENLINNLRRNINSYNSAR